MRIHYRRRYIDSLDARFRDMLLNREISYPLKTDQIMIEVTRKQDNTNRPHGASPYRGHVREAIIQMDRSPIVHQRSHWTDQIGRPRATSTSPSVAFPNLRVSLA